MTDELWQRARAIFEDSLDQPESEREAYVRRRCGSDQALFDEVSTLLEHDRAAPADFVTPPNTPVQGLVLGGFRLERELGRGGMGVVYAAQQVSLGREVALKVLAAGPLADAAAIERFHREARAAAKLDHAHIVRVLDEGTTGELHWFAMERVHGHGLDVELDRMRLDAALSPAAGPILPRPGDSAHIGAVVRIVADLAGALAHAHSRGVVHRDVKPSNILVSQRGEVKLVDFGIARDEALGTLTRPDQLMGSLPYMSPEQARVVDAAVDQRTDVYSLGVVLYELLTLRRPHTGPTSLQMLDQLRNQEAPPVTRYNPRVPRDLALISATALAKPVDERYPSAAEFEADLRRFLAHEAIAVKAPSWLARLRRFMRRRRGTLGLIAAVFSAAIGGAWFVADQQVRRERSADTQVLRQFHAGDSEVEDAELHRVRAALVRLRSSTAAAHKLLVEDVDRRLQELCRSWHAACIADLARGRELLAARPDTGEGERAIVAVIQRAQRLAQHFPEDTESAALAAAFEPRLSVTVHAVPEAPVAGRVSYRALDPRTAQPGPPVALGTLPLDQVPVPHGHLRIVIQLADGSLREYTRHFDLAAHVALDVRAREVSTAGMVLFPAGTCEGLPHEGSPLHEQRLQIEPFWLDACEVSVGDYRLFIDAHPDARVPSLLRELPRGGPDDRRPMTDVTVDEAQRYAEWLGKRLMTHAEWLRACRGDTGRLYPCDGDPLRGSTTARHEPPRSEAERLQLYLQHTSHVDAPDARSPEGVYHLYGNVWEWTESHAAEPVDGRFVPRYESRLVVGGAWNVHTLHFDLRHIRRSTRGPLDHDLTRGFRCARSASP